MVCPRPGWGHSGARRCAPPLHIFEVGTMVQSKFSVQIEADDEITDKELRNLIEVSSSKLNVVCIRDVSVQKLHD